MLSNSKLGFGLMRLPKDKNGTIIQEKVNTMVDAFMKSGFTYFDTAYAYAGSEKAMKKALVERYPREAYTIADKLPAWKLKDENDVQRIFEESLSLSGVDYFDFYLLHSIEKKHYLTYEKYHCFDFIKEMKKQGKIKNIGFSFHDTPEFLDQVLTEHPEVDFVQLQLNYLDWNNGVIQSKKNLEIARKHHKPVVVMEPIKGGALASLSNDIEQVFTDYNPNVSISSWALRFVASLPNVKVVLSGMSTYDQVEDNLATFKEFKLLDQDEEKLVEKVANMIKAKTKNGCTGCRYCMPCPFGIDIPGNFKLWNEYGMLGLKDTAKRRYTNLGDAQAEFCKKCGKCEKLCPQSIKIREDLQRVVQDIKNL